MASLTLTPREDLLAVRRQAATAPPLSVPPTALSSPRPLPERPPSIASLMSDTSQPTDYATEVESLIRASRHPVSVGAGLLAGIAVGATLYRRKAPQRLIGHVIPIAGGLLSGSVVHGATSWALYRSAASKPAGVADAGGLWSTAVSVATVVGVVGGGLYLYDRYKKPRARSRMSDSTLANSTTTDEARYSVWKLLDARTDDWVLLSTVKTPRQAVALAQREFAKGKGKRTIVIEDWENIVALTPTGIEVYGHPEEQDFLTILTPKEAS
jgi:hypothetical protein